MFKVVSNLKILKKNIKEWNKKDFGNIFEEKEKLEVELDLVNRAVMEKGMDADLYMA